MLSAEHYNASQGGLLGCFSRGASPRRQSQNEVGRMRLILTNVTRVAIRECVFAHAQLLSEWRDSPGWLTHSHLDIHHQTGSVFFIRRVPEGRINPDPCLSLLLIPAVQLLTLQRDNVSESRGVCSVHLHKSQVCRYPWVTTATGLDWC